MVFFFSDGNNLVDFTYVKNVVHGHILAAEKLGKGSTACGKVRNILDENNSSGVSHSDGR